MEDTRQAIIEVAASYYANWKIAHISRELSDLHLGYYNGALNIAKLLGITEEEIIDTAYKLYGKTIQDVSNEYLPSF